MRQRKELINALENLADVLKKYVRDDYVATPKGMTVYPGFVVYHVPTEQECIVCAGQSEAQLARSFLNVWVPGFGQSALKMNSKYFPMEELESGFRSRRDGKVINFVPVQS